MEEGDKWLLLMALFCILGIFVLWFLINFVL
jgi:hypothetical protein